MPNPANPEKSGVYQVVWGPQRFRLSVGWKTLIAFSLVVLLQLTGITIVAEKVLLKVMQQNTSSTLAASLHSALRSNSDRIGVVGAVLAHSATDPAAKEALRSKDMSRLGRLAPAACGATAFCGCLACARCQG